MHHAEMDELELPQFHMIYSDHTRVESLLLERRSRWITSSLTYNGWVMSFEISSDRKSQSETLLDKQNAANAAASWHIRSIQNYLLRCLALFAINISIGFFFVYLLSEPWEFCWVHGIVDHCSNEWYVYISLKIVSGFQKFKLKASLKYFNGIFSAEFNAITSKSAYFKFHVSYN